MKYYAVYDLVGIQVDEGYPWFSTLFITQGVSVQGVEQYQASQRKIEITYQKELRMDDVRFIGDGAYIGQDVYVDTQYGARIERMGNGFRLIAAQECNEWLVILLQLALLETHHTIIHAAGLEKDGQALIFPSWGGVGKTATVCRYVRNYGWKLMGDDLLIVGEGQVLPFLKPFVIYPYHKDLFPELFSNGENHTVKNMALSNMMSHAIPTVKRMLRPFPRVLAYLRKHNPQSMRVSPYRIFQQDQLSKGGVPFHMVWLERSMKENVVYRSLTPEELASKAASVSSVEIFAARLESVYHMCGCGMLHFEDVVLRMHQIILNMAQNTKCDLLEIPTAVNITGIGELIHQTLEK